jgi:hypothetical protein
MKPERDPVLCEHGRCDREAEVATPAGALCRPHAEALAEVET